MTFHSTKSRKRYKQKTTTNKKETKRKKKNNSKTNKKKKSQSRKSIRGGIRGGEVQMSMITDAPKTTATSEFIQCFPSNLEKVEKAISQYSGIHSIDMTIANEFISNQISPIRRQAAQDLIDNTHYITLKEIDTIIKTLVQKLFAENDTVHHSSTIYVVTGNVEKSSYFLTVLAFKYISQQYLAKKYIFIKTLTNDLLDEIGNIPILFIDDVSYSGSQLSDLLNNIYYNYVVVGKKAPPNIYILLAALNHVSEKKLSEVPYDIFPSIKPKPRFTPERKPSPFKLIYLPERVYEPLIYKLGIERYLNLLLCFSTFTAGDFLPIVSIYLDHKLADPVSTLTTALSYGPIMPNNLHYQGLADSDQIIFNGSFVKAYDEIKMNPLVESFNKSNGTSFKPNMIGYFIFNKFVSLDKPDKTGSPFITFKPFINICNKNPGLLSNITDPEIIHFDYFLFLAPEGCISGEFCSKDNGSIQDYAGVLDKKDAKEKLEQLVKIHNKINNYRCPETWYKNGPHQMTCS